MTSLRTSNMNSMRSIARGFSLVELMVALAAGLIVSSAVVAFLMSSFKSNSDYVVSTRLTQELRNTLDLVTRDLRRAGYDETSVANMGTGRISLFSHMKLCDTAGTCITTTTRPTAAEPCVIYGYDRVNGTAGTVDVSNGEVRGLRRKQVTNINGVSVGVIEYAVSTNAIEPACDGAGPVYTTFPTVCNAATAWCPLTDATKLDITSFTLTDNGAVAGGVLLRDLTVVLQGRPAGTTEYTRGVQSSVRIRSDCYATALTDCVLTPTNH